ncbi:hypothetical protein FF38_03904 [Lucilia cuprina]|uniref:Uncharacterized protein n=1 Tax=Lucilia cuprina TaxID=7375 RepID=A0A0L0C5T7_LUCCU|nr:hypothetical protein FF38_03904 [Lucilia cuprina]
MKYSCGPIYLGWIQKAPETLKTTVSNRIRDITDTNRTSNRKFSFATKSDYAKNKSTNESVLLPTDILEEFSTFNKDLQIR